MSRPVPFSRGRHSYFATKDTKGNRFCMGTAGSAQFHRKDREGSVSRLVVKLEGRVVHNLISKTEGVVCRVW